MATAAASSGINTRGTTTLTDCLVEDNSAEVRGGGLEINGGTTTLTGSTRVRGNHADTNVSSAGGGIFINGGTLVIAETYLVTENTAASGNGGGIRNSGGTVTLQGANPSPIVVNNCHENCVGSVPQCAATPISCPP